MLVETLSDVERNVDTLVEAIRSSSDDQRWFADLVKAGAVFYPYQYGRTLAFAPSRFIGYKENSREKHQKFVANGIADGKETNPVISKILGSKPIFDDRLEEAFLRYCSDFGVVPYKKKRSYWAGSRIIHALSDQLSAINDIGDGDIGNQSPEYKRRMAGVYVRDPAVRRQVLQRANGRCEFGSCTTFQKANGQSYLESHHVISLSEQGEDRLSNVIALCPNHHREAHFGANWESLQDEFLIILKKMV